MVCCWTSVWTVVKLLAYVYILKFYLLILCDTECNMFGLLWASWCRRSLVVLPDEPYICNRINMCIYISYSSLKPAIIEYQTMSYLVGLFGTIVYWFINYPLQNPRCVLCLVLFINSKGYTMLPWELFFFWMEHPMMFLPFS